MMSSMALACRTASASPYCLADLNDDLQTDFFDVSAFITRYSEGDLGVDLDHNGVLNFFDVSAFLVAFNNGCPDLTDSDGDRIPDFAETDDGVFIDLFKTGTDPHNPDTDTDGLSDGDEILGTLDGLELPQLGANPLRRDIFLECDWYAGEFNGTVADYRPTDAVVQRVVDAFKNAPVSNPYGADSGIDIHIDYGQDATTQSDDGGLFVGGQQLPGAPIFLLFDFDFNILKSQYFDDSRRGFFHYAIFAHRYNSPSNNSSGVGELPGNDFMVTLSTYNTEMVMANTILHELGHNLGFRHGGFEDRNWKPNYNSVMNYRYQFPGIDSDGDALGDGIGDYSWGFSPAIDESAVLELSGIDGETPIDWDGDDSINPEPYTANINCLFRIRPCGLGTDCDDNTCDVLLDQNDWDMIRWDRLSASVDRLPQPEVIECDNWPGKFSP